MQKAIGFSVSVICFLSIGCGNKKTAQTIIPFEGSGGALEEILDLSYVGNMGVLIESHEKTVLFDGFHKEYGPDYEYPTKAMVEELRQGEYNDFSNIEIVCVTHKHGDHFDPMYSAEFLKGNNEAIVIGPNQVKQEIVKHKEGVEERVKAITYDNEPHSIHHKGIDVKAIRCDHVNQKRHASIENIAYVVEIDDFKILHVGDTNWSEASPTFLKLALKNISIDVAIVPYWMLLDDTAKEKVQQLISPRHIVATHIPPNFSHNDSQALQKEFTSITLFTELGENLAYKKPNR